MIQIKRQTPTGRIVVFETPLNEGCKANGTLMESQGINIKFATEYPIAFKVGDYVDLRDVVEERNGERFDYRFPSFIKMKYVLMKPTYPTRNQISGGYDYDLKLVSFHEAWGNMVYKFVIGISGEETKFSYTGTLREHLALFLENIKANADSHVFSDFLDEQLARLGKTSYDELNEYNVFDVDESYIEERHVFLSFDGTKMSDVLKTLCSEENFDCDFWYDGVFHLGKCENGELLELNSMGENPDCSVTSSDASGEFANRIIFYGSEKNLTARYRRDLEFIANDILSEIPQGQGALSSYNSEDYLFFFRDKDKKHLSIDMIKNRNRIGGGKSYHVFGDGRFKSYDEDGFSSPVDGAQIPFGSMGDHKSYQKTNPFRDLLEGNVYTFNTHTLNIGVIGSHVVRVTPHFNFFPRVWFYNNREFVDDGLGRKSMELPISAMFFTAKLKSGMTVVSEKTIWGAYDGEGWKHGEASSPINIPTTYEFIPNEAYSPKDYLTLNAQELGGEFSVEISYGVVLKDVDRMGDYLFRCQIDGFFSLAGGYGAISGECDIILNGTTYEKAIVFNPVCNDNGENLYSYFGMKKTAYQEILNDGNSVVLYTHFKLGDILYGKVPVSYFSKENDGNKFINSILNRNLRLPERYYLKYTKTEKDGVVEYGDIEYSFDPKDGFAEYNQTFLDIYEGIHPSEIIEKTNVNDKIFPMMGDENHNGEEILQAGLYNSFKDDDTAYEEGKWHYQYAFNTKFNFTDDALIAGEDLRVRFTSGSMNGMEFDVQFYPTLESGLTLQDGNTLHNEWTGGKCFVISPNEDYGAELPNNIIYPQAGDRFILIGFDPTALDDDNNMVTNAEKRLLADAVKRANQIRNNTATYTATLFADQHTNLDDYYIGRMVKVYDDATMTKRQSRILGYDIFLDYPYDHPSFTIGQSAEYSRLRSIENFADTKSNGKLN